MANFKEIEIGKNTLVLSLPIFEEGERKHGSDNRIVQQNDEIHVFYRDRQHMEFEYKSRAVLNSYRLFKNRPSKFSFQLLIDIQRDKKDIVSEIQYKSGLRSTERTAIIKHEHAIEIIK